MPIVTGKKLCRVVRNAVMGWMPGGKRECVMCGHLVWGFSPYRSGFQVPLMDALGFISGDMANFGCPRCGCHDRERHLVMYMRASGLIDLLPALRVLHFAPESRLGPWIRSFSPACYVPCDLHPTTNGVQHVDIEDMPFEDESFDLIIANHVLEHVTDDKCAVSEIQRVLSPGGYAILQTPYSAMLAKTWSDTGIVSEQARLHAYGQEDHVRLYGSDIVSRISSFGLSSRVTSHTELLGGMDSRRFGVGASEPFFLFQKNLSS